MGHGSNWKKSQSSQDRLWTTYIIHTSGQAASPIQRGWPWGTQWRLHNSTRLNRPMYPDVRVGLGSAWAKLQSMDWVVPPWGEGIWNGALRMVSINPNRVEPPVPLHSLRQLFSRPSEQHRMVRWQLVYLRVTLDFSSSLAWLCIGWEGCEVKNTDVQTLLDKSQCTTLYDYVWL